MKLLSVLGLAALAVADPGWFPINQVPFNLPLETMRKDNLDCIGNSWTTPRLPRIAIIGSGAAGSSAAYFLHHFGRVNPALAAELVIFESESYVGGRSTILSPWNTIPTQHDADEAPVELGASIFAPLNENLIKATKLFNLTTVPQSESAALEKGGMAIWDGTEFVYEEKEGFGWGFSYVRMFWRYGRSPLRLRSVVKSTVDKFTRVYSSEFIKAGGPYDSIYDFARATNLTETASDTAESYFAKEGISPLFTNELIAAATTVNYGQSPSKISALGALVSLAATGALSVVGGNRKIFEQFVARSGATLQLSSKVLEVIKLDESKAGGRAQWVVKGGKGGTFDAVIIATPFKSSKIKIVNSRAMSKIPSQPYVHLHVTFVITNATAPQPSYFSLAEKSTIPKSIFTTFSTSSSIAALKPLFNSLNYLKPLSAINSAKFGEGQFHVVKLFSAASLEENEIEKIFGRENVGKVVRKEWDAYPVLKPIEREEDFASVRPDQGLYYVNAMERLISTMETETVAASNVVALLLQDFFSYSAEKSWARWDEEE